MPKGRNNCGITDYLKIYYWENLYSLLLIYYLLLFIIINAMLVELVGHARGACRSYS